MFLLSLISVVCLVLRRDKLDDVERDLEEFVLLVNAVLALGKFASLFNTSFYYCLLYGTDI